MEIIPCVSSVRIRATLANGNRLFDGRNSLERINARVGRDSLFDDPFIRGRASMQLQIAGSMALMMAIAVGCQEKNKPDNMRSLAQLAALVLTILPEADAAASRNSLKIRCFATWKFSNKAPESPENSSNGTHSQLKKNLTRGGGAISSLFQESL